MKDFLYDHQDLIVTAIAIAIGAWIAWHLMQSGPAWP